MIPAGWTEWEPFRASFLMHFTPRHAALLQQLGAFLCEVVLLPDYQEGKDEEEPLLVARLRAATADLRWVAGFLAVLGALQSESQLRPEEITLSRRAAATSLEIERLLGEIEGELAARG